LKSIGNLGLKDEIIENRKEFFDRHASFWDERLKFGEKISQLLEVVKWFGLAQGDSVLDERAFKSHRRSNILWRQRS